MISLNTIEEIQPEIPNFIKFDCVVIISRYDSGKTSIVAEEIIRHFGESRTLYVTFIDQSKPNFTPRDSQLKFGQIVKDKIIVFDELVDEKCRDVSGYARQLIEGNLVIILTNPYGDESSDRHEVELFKKVEGKVIPENTLFIYVRN